MTSLDPLERVVSTLARDPNLPRVKKLLYCACYGVWEDNTERLNQVSLQEIVQGVWERSPTLEALQFQLNRVVKTLNKPVAYAHVANGVLQVLNDLYFDTYDITQPVMVNRVQFPLSMTGAPGPSAQAGNPNPAAASHGAASHGYGMSGPEPEHHGEAQVNPRDRFESPFSPQQSSHHSYQGNFPPIGQQGYDSAHGANQGYPNLGSSYSSTNPPPASHSQVGHSPAGYSQDVASQDSPATQWFVGGQQHQPGSLTPAQLSAQTAVRAHVLQSLTQHLEERRMKKLLVCVCHNQWENNRAHLAALDWELLLDETRQLMPTLQGLEHVLKAIVNSLSKPVEYLEVAQLLLDMVTPLYEQERPDETQFFGVTPEPSAREVEQSPDPADYWRQRSARKAAPSQAGPTYPPTAASHFRPPTSVLRPQPGAPSDGMFGGQPSRRTSDSFSHAPNNGGVHNSAFPDPEGNDGPPTGLFAPQLPVSPMDSKYPPRALPRTGEYPGDAIAETTAAIAQPMTAHPVAAHPMAGQAGANVYKDAQAWGEGESPELRSDESGVTSEEEAENDEFTLRLSLMRYANPLMSKVVIFSALYRLFRFSEQDWVELRRHSLASLMGELEVRYPNLIDLEMKLCGVAEQLEVPEQAMQTVAALLKVLKPRYDSARQAPARDRGLAIAVQAPPRPVGVEPVEPFNRAEKATAIQFGPDGEADARVTSMAIASPEAPAQPVIAEVLPSEAASCEALMSGDLIADALLADDLEADLALLAASLEDDGPSLPQDS